MYQSNLEPGEGGSILERLKELEFAIAALEFEFSNDDKLLTRKGLSQMLSCSERYLQSHPEFKLIEHRMGNRVYYNWAQVKRIIFNTKGVQHE